MSKSLTLVTSAALGGALIATRLPELTELKDEPAIVVGNHPQTAIPCLQTEHTQVQLLPVDSVVAAITKLLSKAQCREEQASLNFLKATLSRSGATHFWVA